MKLKTKLLAGAAGFIALAGVAVAQQVFPIVSAVTGGMLIQDASNPTAAYMRVSQIGTYLQGTNGITDVSHGGTGNQAMGNHLLIISQGGGTALATVANAGTGQLLASVTSADPAFTTTLSGNYTLSGTNTFTGTLNQLGSASGVPSHISTAQTTAPALTSCGTGSPVITGTDTAGIVTMGTNATGCVITFNVAYTGAPYCVVSWIATPLASQSYVTANTAITLTQTSASGNRAQYICVGTAGG